MKASRVHSRWQTAGLAGTERALAPAHGAVSTEAASGAAAECRTASRLDPRGPARLRSPWITAAIAAIGTSLAIAALAPLPYPQSLEDSCPIGLLWQDGIAMQVSGYVLLALTFVGLSFSLRKRWARLRCFDYRGWRLFHGCLGVLGLAVLFLCSDVIALVQDGAVFSLSKSHAKLYENCTDIPRRVSGTFSYLLIRF